MRQLVCLTLLVICLPALAATLADDAYVCKDKQIAQSIVDDPDLSALGAADLFGRTSAASVDLAGRIAHLDRDIAKTKLRVDNDREALKTAKTLEFQAGIHRNLHPAEQSLQQSEALLGNLASDRDQLAGELHRWEQIAGACFAAESKKRVAVLQTPSSSKLSVVRVRAGATATQVWVPSRFFVATAQRKK